jgi:hypothetical protein
MPQKRARNDQLGETYTAVSNLAATRTSNWILDHERPEPPDRKFGRTFWQFFGFFQHHIGGMPTGTRHRTRSTRTAADGQ